MLPSFSKEKCARPSSMLAYRDVRSLEGAHLYTPAFLKMLSMSSIIFTNKPRAMSALLPGLDPKAPLVLLASSVHNTG